MMVWIVIGLLAWVALSFALGPLLGRALRGSDVLERARSVEALQARAQHPSSRAA